MEIVRKIFRSMFGYNSEIYKLGATIIDCVSTILKEGIGTWRTLCEIKEEKEKGGAPRSITFRNLNHPIYLRPGTQDVRTIIDNIIREEYGHFSFSREPAWMIDAGVYIGDTSAYFLSRFSALKVIALEPHHENYQMAQQNLAPYGERVRLLSKGLFSNEETHHFSGSETSAKKAHAGREIACTTIPALLKEYAIENLDIVKMDIEGAEEAIFLLKPEEWLLRVKLLIIETHGPHIETLIARVLKENNFSVQRYRSLWYCRAHN